VVGLARSGRAAALALARRGLRVVAVDRSRDADPGRLAGAGVEVHLGTEDESLLDMVELVVKSPGVPGDTPLVAGARRLGLPVWSEVEVGARVLANPLLGVTGTNGKTTTSELLGVMLDAPVAGNVGRALCDLDGRVAPDAWVVCELSSFQLEDVHSLRARAAVLLNVEPDHLDRHGSFEAYRDAKLRIFERQRPEDVAVVPRGFPDVPGSARRVEFRYDDELPAEPRMRGRHNRENAAAATAAARAIGLDDAAIARALATFPGVAHRLELVGEIAGVAYVNDSKATNVAAARRALDAYADEPVHLILGGSLKGESFDALAAAIGPNVRRVYLVGEAAEELAAALGAARRSYEQSGELASAVGTASVRAEPGDVVLLSPACASYDQYRNFEERGDHFRRLVQELE
jgi:UDP-N-acetylmuramoylalanine--D-glutamate ligase